MLCSKCLREKSVVDFSFRDRKRGVLHKMCKLCHTKYRRQHYLQHREKYIKKASRWNRKQRDVLREYIFKKLMESACIDCGEKDIVVLDFDHISGKRLGISLMFRNRYSVAAIKEEMQKCVIRCANCHRRKTAREFGHWKHRIQYTDIGA